MGITLSGISLAGINSGIDSDLIVQQMMAAASQPLYRLQARKAKWNAKSSALDQIESLLNTLKSHAASMDTVAELRKTTAKSSDTDIVTATASSTAIEGSHTVTVNQLARAEREVQTTGVATLETVIYIESDDTFTYTYNGSQRSVTIQEEQTLEDLVETINSDDSNPGVTASILQYSGAYHLVLAGNDTGKDATITVDTSPASIGGFTETQAAQSAEIKVDGFPTGAEDWIERDSNSITDVLPGVTLNLQSVSASPVTITLTRKTSDLTSDLTNFVAIYNSLADKIKN
ncbi:MAG: flagellar filament capping protein FliD, partial [Phycisphaerae bacterium]|nr:flagellar filament capping protein FliD [Phycisphaerae bacterium]